MSNTSLIIEERSRDIGNFLVGRLLPFRKKRMVGPFIFIDHMGPSTIAEGQYLDVNQHPHIGLSTLTYLFEGEIMHEDSIGTKQRVVAGDVNFMTAGKGVTHTERTPPDHRADGQVRQMHGFQIWIALPKELEEMEPEFHHLNRAELPKWQENGLEFALIAGEGYGKKCPLPVYSELFLVEIKSQQKAKVQTREQLKGEIGICVVDGYIEANGERIEKGNMLVSKEEDVCEFVVGENSHLLLFGGQPFEEKRYIFWNFVSSDRDRLEAAKTRWQNKEFPKVAGDNTYVPLPQRK